MNERTLFFALLSALLSCFALYIYFVTSSVVQVVIRSELEQRIVETTAKTNKLEAEYMEAQNTISADIASRYGYVPIERKLYIDRTPDTLVLSNREQ